MKLNVKENKKYVEMCRDNQLEDFLNFVLTFRYLKKKNNFGSKKKRRLNFWGS